MIGDEKKYWYNLVTGEVEHGRISLGSDLAGPFDTREEAQRAPEIIRERARAWADEDSDDWGHDQKDDSDNG